MELNTVNKNIKNIAILVAIALILITIIRLNYPLLYNPSLSSYKDSSSLSTYHADDVKISDNNQDKCDIFTGEWVPNPDAPYYTNTTCWAIHEHQNCMKYGRPDSDFLKWRWKPDGCDLPVFNPYQFLDMVRGKSLAFVGDSVGRNQMQSMICLLSRVSIVLHFLLYIYIVLYISWLFRFVTPFFVLLLHVCALKFTFLTLFWFGFLFMVSLVVMYVHVHTLIVIDYRNEININ